MGLIQNKVTVSQPNSHVVVKNAGGLRGLTGETGPQGPQGVPGEAATVTAGTTTTLPAGSDATVQNVGSTSAAIFNFGIPKGDKGDTGETGTAATISVGTTTTLEPGEDATVTNSGTSSAAVFDFGIPKGAKGDTGDTGPAGQDGADGFSPTATVSKTGDTATITITDKDGTTTAQISDGVTPTIDPALSPTSENPVQNKVVTNALAGKADKPIVVSSLPATGTAGQEYFVDDRYNTVTELKGDTTQTTYSGKNLVPITNQDFTINSVRFTSGNGRITVKGTASDTIYGLLSQFKTNYGFTKPAGTYTFSRVSSNLSVMLVNTANDTVVVSCTDLSPSAKTFTLTGETNLALGVYIASGSVIDTTVAVQLEAGSTATSFEPYVGGTASPNPDYPQEVQTVTGEQTVTVVGKNLAKLTDCSLSDTGYTLTTVNGSVVLTSASRNSFFDLGAGIRTGNWIPDYNSSSVSDNHLTPADNGTYTLSLQEFQLSVTGTQNLYFSIFTNTREMRITISPTATSFAPYTFTLNNGEYVKTLGIWTGESDSAISNKFKVQLEKNSQSTSYAPYQGGSYPINLGKNLFDKDNANVINAWAGPDYVYSGDVLRTLYISCDPNTTYTVQKENTGTNNRFMVFTTAVTPVVGVPVLNYVGTSGAEDNNSSYTITTPANARYLCVFFANTNVTTPAVEDILATIQIEKGSTATAYAPYFTPIELCKIGTYQDYIYKSGEDWYVHKETGKVTFTGAVTETWSSATAATGYARFSTASGETHADNNGYCNEFINRGSQSHGAYEYVWVQPNANAFYIQLLNTRVNDIAGFRTWLGANPATVYYDISTATDTQITDATLIAQLEALTGAKVMVDGGTATVTSQYLPATLTTAYNSNSGYIDYIYDGTNFVKVR